MCSAFNLSNQKCLSDRLSLVEHKRNPIKCSFNPLFTRRYGFNLANQMLLSICLRRSSARRPPPPPTKRKKETRLNSGQWTKLHIHKSPCSSFCRSVMPMLMPLVAMHRNDFSRTSFPSPPLHIHIAHILPLGSVIAAVHACFMLPPPSQLSSYNSSTLLHTSHT